MVNEVGDGNVAANQNGGGAAAIQTNFTIDKFDRNVTAWSRWVQRLEGAFSVFNVADEKKIHFILHFMGQESFDLVCDKIAPTSPYEKTYKDITDLLKEHYDPAPLEIMENYRFHLRKQKEHENVQDFVSALRKFSINCNFGAY